MIYGLVYTGCGVFQACPRSISLFHAAHKSQTKLPQSYHRTKQPTHAGHARTAPHLQQSLILPTARAQQCFVNGEGKKKLYIRYKVFLSVMYGAALIEVSGLMPRPSDINYSLNTNAAENSPLIDLVINASTQVCSHSGLPGKVRFIMVTFSWYYAPTLSYCCQGTDHRSTKVFLKTACQPPKH